MPKRLNRAIVSIAILWLRLTTSAFVPCGIFNNCFKLSFRIVTWIMVTSPFEGNCFCKLLRSVHAQVEIKYRSAGRISLKYSRVLYEKTLALAPIKYRTCSAYTSAETLSYAITAIVFIRTTFLLEYCIFIMDTQCSVLFKTYRFVF